MRLPRMSIRTMLGLVAFIALACVGLARENAVWSSLMFTAALATTSFAILAAIFRRGEQQAFWIGFALFGWLYLWMAHWPSEFQGVGLNQPASWNMQTDESGPLATTRLLVYSYNHWLPKARTLPVEVTSAPSVDPNAPFGAVGAFPGASLTGTIVLDYPALHEYARVGHSLFTVIAAFVGAFVATYLYRTRDRAARIKRTSNEPIAG